MWVVKLGGSLQSFQGLQRWVHLIAETGCGRLVLVPGGGQFADAVRETQRTAGFDDRIAHGMALRAMEQYGLLLSAMAPGLVPAHSDLQMRVILAEGRVPVWMPHAMASTSPDVTPDWTFTSDSLSLWLARRLRAEALLLIKSVPMPRDDSTVEELAGAGLIDGAFAPLARDYAGEIGWFGREESGLVETALRGLTLRGVTRLKRGGRETTPRAAARGA